MSYIFYFIIFNSIQKFKKIKIIKNFIYKFEKNQYKKY